MKSRATIHFVGLGPGEPALLTQRAAHLLSIADAVGTDDPLDGRLLAMLRPDVEMLKLLPSPAVALVERARRPGIILRVRRGDPFLGGGLTDEIMALRAEGLDFEVVPGFSSVFLYPEFAGIPLIHEGVSRSFLVLAGPYGLVSPGSAAPQAPTEVAPPPEPPPPPPEPKRPGVTIKKRKKAVLEDPRSSRLAIRVKDPNTMLVVEEGEDPPAAPAVPAPPPPTVPSSQKDPRYWSPDDTHGFFEALPPASSGQKTIRMEGVEVDQLLSAPAPAAPAPVAPPPPPPAPEVLPGPVYAVDWSAASKATDTLVLIEPMEELEAVQAGLLEAGRSPDVLVAAIAQAATVRQQTIVTTIGEMVHALRPHRLPSPVLLVVGEVVSLRGSLDFFERRPLFGLRLAVLGDDEFSPFEQRLLEDAGVRLRSFPIFSQRPTSGLSELLSELRDDFRSARHLVFTDERTVEVFFQALTDANIDLRVFPERAQLVAVGSATEARLRRNGLRSVRLEGPYSEEGLLEYFPPRMQGERVLLLSHTTAQPELTRELRKRGALITEIPLYDRQPNEAVLKALRQALVQGECDAAAVLSRRVVDALVRAWGAEALGTLFDEVLLAALGPAVAAALTNAGLSPQLEAQQATAAHLLELLEEWKGQPIQMTVP